MSYNYNNFLRQISPGDRNIQVLDSTGIVKYTINPFSIINVMVSNNLIKINLKNDKTIILDFYSAIQAKSAIVQLQGHIDTLSQNVPFLIDKNIENYIQDQKATLMTATISNVEPVSWKLGSTAAGSVAVDTTQYIEVSINGSIYKLAIVQ